MTTIKINDTEIKDDIKTTVNRTLSEFNSISSFESNIDNFNGKNSNTFTLNDKVEIISNNKTIFLGIIEKVKYNSKEKNETIKISGRDYSASLIDVMVYPTVFRGNEVSQIVKKLTQRNIDGITLNNVNTTSTTLERIVFSQKSIFDCLKDLAEISGFYFYVDTNKDLHLEEKETISSGETLDNTNILQCKKQRQDNDIYNEVRIFGKNILVSDSNQATADGTGSVFTTDAKPHNLKVSVNNTIKPQGGIFEMNDPSVNENLQWVLNFDESEVIFVSGTAAGNHIPASGDTVDIDYQKSIPIIKHSNDTTSQDKYGRKVKVVRDDNIQSFSEATTKADNLLNEHSDPTSELTVNIHGFLDIEPGNTITIDLPSQNIINETYTILDIKYDLDKTTYLKENICTIKLNKKASNVLDTISEIAKQQKIMQMQNIGVDLTSTKTQSRDLDVLRHYELWSLSGTHFPFKFHKTGQNKLNDPYSALGPWNVGSSFLQSGGDF